MYTVRVYDFNSFFFSIIIKNNYLTKMGRN